MRIKTKLAASSGTVLLLMALVGAACIAGIKHIERNIFYLTQKSTPYQIKTFNHQRALQSHASNLLKIASAESAEEFGILSPKCTESLAEEIKAAEDLTTLGSPGDYQGAEITGITGRIQDNTRQRLALQRETDAAVAMMRTNLAEASKRLKELDASIRKLQGAATAKMISNVTITADSNNQSAMIASLLSGLKDLTLFTSQLMNASDREAVEAGYDGTSNPLHKITDLVGLIRWSGKLSRQDYLRKLEYVSDKLTEAKDMRLEFLQSRAASSSAKTLQAVREAEAEIANLREGAKGQAETASITQEASADAMSSSTSSFESTNSILLLTSGILFSGAAVESQINYGVAARSTSDFDKIASTVHAEFLKIESAARELVKLLGSGKRKKESSQVNGSIAALDAVKKSFFATGGASEKIKASLKSVEEVAGLNQRMKEMVARQMELSGKDVAAAQQGQQQAVSSVRSAVKTTTMLIVVIAGVSVLASLLLSRWIGLSITRPIRELSTMAERFGSGDFGIRMDASRKDEFGILGAHFNEATSKLAQMTGLLKDSIGKLTVSSQGLSNTSDELYRGSQEQVSQTTQSSVAMTEISATVETVAGHARSSAAASKEAHSIAADGNVLVARTVHGMHEISESVMAAATMINKLSESSEKIDSILLAIDDIADQTSLLALNAAIEAAHAGEHGQGFSVVADEVRKLSQRTAVSTREISEIIQNIQADTAGSVSAMEKGKRKVEEGRSLVAAACDSLNAIVAVSQRGVEMADLIATATNEQASVSREVSESMDKIAKVTGTLKDSTVAIKEASQQLSAIAGELNGMASWFKVAA